MGPAVDRLETSILNKTLFHDGNPVLTWCAANAVTVPDPAGARKLDKSKSYDRIDALDGDMGAGFKPHLALRNLRDTGNTQP